MDPDWLEQVYLATDRLFETNLGPKIYESARAFCPVLAGQNSTANIATRARMLAQPGYTPGALRDSIEFHLSGHSLIVSASGSADRTYAYWVETGHNVVAWGHDMHWRKPIKPFLRPALYMWRGTE